MWRVEKVSRSKEKKNYLFAECKKTFGKIISLPSAKEKHSANLLLCRVPLMDTGKLLTAGTLTDGCPRDGFLLSVSRLPSVFFLVCRVVFFQHSTKRLVCRVPLFCRVWFLQHSANNFCTECPIKYTRQIFWHSTNLLFPVVVQRHNGSGG